MPKVIGTERKFFKNSVIKEEDIPTVVMKIRGCGKKDGKDLYGFFVTTEEFAEKLASVYCFDGWYDVPILEYEKGEPIVLLGGSPKNNSNGKEQYKPSKEFLKKVERGEFIKQNDMNVRKQLQELGIPVREIKLWHKYGWAFAELDIMILLFFCPKFG